SLKQSVIVGFDGETSRPDRLQTRPQRIAVGVLADVGGMDDPSEPDERRIRAQFELLDQDFEAALPVAVRELGARRVEGTRSLRRRDPEHLLAWDEQELGVGIDEP